MSNTPFDSLVNNLLNALPSATRDLRDDTEKNIRAALEAGLQKLNLVSRSEFDAQTAVLEKTRQQLRALQDKLDEIESRIKT